ncbi:MAG: NVEALA domain-containing protein [Bacteroides sp.]|nr:NVEALA domain-containing protein [Bacteroides sp.]
MKKYVKVAFMAVVAAVAGYNVYQSQSVMNGMSDFALANVEALADGEYSLDDLNDYCYWYEYQDCYYLIVKPDGNTVWWHSNFEERICL